MSKKNNLAAPSSFFSEQVLTRGGKVFLISHLVGRRVKNQEPCCSGLRKTAGEDLPGHLDLLDDSEPGSICWLAVCLWERGLRSAGPYGREPKENICGREAPNQLRCWLEDLCFTVKAANHVVVGGVQVLKLLYYYIYNVCNVLQCLLGSLGSPVPPPTL